MSSPPTGLHSPVPLPARLPVGELAARSVAAAGAALAGTPNSSPDPQRVAAAYRSDRHLLIDGEQPDVWSPLSGFWRTADGWVRTHANYPHHAVALRAGLGLDTHASSDDLRALLAATSTQHAVAAVRARGGLCVPVRREDPATDAALRQHPIVAIERLGNAPKRALPRATPSRPLDGVRVLDLTRVIAGPVATRTLAFAGADVLRIDPPTRPEFAWQHLDTGHGKRTALVDTASESELVESLLHDADVVVLGYRPEGLRRFGLSPQLLGERHPHLVVAQLTAWPGADSPRGFDSLVQAESGIAWCESPDGETPGALPAQALDHSAGYLLAAGIADALRRRESDGGTWFVSTSLRRVAAELLGMPRRPESAHDESAQPPASPETQSFSVGGHDVITVVPAVTWPGAPTRYASPREWGADTASW
ncbi:CoA transferase [Microbacterium esteraromaticum]|uniref:CoA transferase n=1 Tax=Microbacterium esteraromaticum TaxID=57043 RepID=UPI0019D32724|nr:CoA transferase [Microbacterium esteraromaticum]MBN7794948.1 CoA transferase [Microbacterium esteraromaticum]